MPHYASPKQSCEILWTWLDRAGIRQGDSRSPLELQWSRVHFPPCRIAFAQSDEMRTNSTGATLNRTFRLLSATGDPYDSGRPGTIGGHQKLKIYGRLDCPSALRWLAKGHYAKHRVFFENEAAAVSAGYRPCSRCMKEAYQKWKQQQQ
jgi:hypothetical protein